MDPTQIDELDELLGSLRDDALSDEQAARLDELLRGDGEARRYYIDYVNLRADLRRYYGGGEAVLLPFARETQTDKNVYGGAPALPSPMARGGRMRIVAGLLAMAAGVAAMASLATLWLKAESKSPWVTGDNGVAVLTREADARWEGRDKPTVGAAMGPGVLRLESGLAQVEFYSGATVVLEGPAEFEVVSAERGLFRRGKVRAHVPPQARGFTIGARGVDVVDLGTEFGLSVDEGGKAEVHVLDGEVRLERGEDKQTLTTGQGVRFVGAGQEKIAADDRAFVNTARLSGLADESVRRRRMEWLEESLRISQDPSVILHYTFEGQQPWDRTVENRAAKAPGSRSDPAINSNVGAIVGAQWSEGRWAGKRALEFKRTSDRVRIAVPGSYPAMTLAAWVRFDGFDRQWNSLVLTDGWEPGEPHWQVSSAGELILGVRLSDTTGVNYVSPKGVLGPSHLGRWVHLATTYDSKTGSVNHYIDGRAVPMTPTLLGPGSLSQLIPPALTIGQAEIGNWAAWNQPKPQPQDLRNLNGRIDELVLFSRSLSDRELTGLYKAGKPHP